MEWSNEMVFKSWKGTTTFPWVLEPFYPSIKIVINKQCFERLLSLDLEKVEMERQILNLLVRGRRGDLQPHFFLALPSVNRLANVAEHTLCLLVRLPSRGDLKIIIKKSYWKPLLSMKLSTKSMKHNLL